MPCLMLLSSRRWFCALSGSGRGRISELTLVEAKRLRPIAPLYGE
jgi:hypothetical protein